MDLQESNPSLLRSSLLIIPDHTDSGCTCVCRLWAAKIGQDFVPQCNLLGIDYCSIHLWPDNWNTFDPKFPTTWITAHEGATKILNKPLVLEEVRGVLLILSPMQSLILGRHLASSDAWRAYATVGSWRSSEILCNVSDVKMQQRVCAHK